MKPKKTARSRVGIPGYPFPQNVVNFTGWFSIIHSMALDEVVLRRGEDAWNGDHCEIRL
jgi:hypothetical protein